MKKILQKYGILFFFCAMMGGIIIIDSIVAISFLDKERGLANEFSRDTKKLSILQADSKEAFCQNDLLAFLQRRKVDGKINMLKVADQDGIELYSSELPYFKDKSADDWKASVLLRKDTYEKWLKTGDSNYYYKGRYFNVSGIYEKNELEESYVVDMQGVINYNPEEAVKGVYYFDCGQDTNLVFEELNAEILAKNQYAQISVLEESSEGNLFNRLGHSQNALYYLIQMGLLLILNLFNFGNIAGYWVNARKTEIFVRKMVGGTDISIFVKLIVTFAKATGIFMITGMLIGTAIVGNSVKNIGKAFLFGSMNCVIQWLIFLVFGGILLWKYLRKTMIEMEKS